MLICRRFVCESNKRQDKRGNYKNKLWEALIRV